MLPSHLKRKIDELWNRFWSAGLTNPLTAIEQITYLLFLYRLQHLDDLRVKQGKRSIYTLQPGEKRPSGKRDYEDCRWNYIRDYGDHAHLTQVVFPWLRTLEERLGGEGGELGTAGGRMADAHFHLAGDKGETLKRALKIVDELFSDLRGTHSDVMGDVFEHLLSEIQSSGKNGQFRTPRHLVRFLVELLDPSPGARVIDPAAGSGGFLFATLQHWHRLATDPDNVVLEWDGTPHRLDGGDAGIDALLEPDALNETLTGWDNDRTMVRIGWMNLILHGVANPRFEQRDSLGKSLPTEESGRYDCVLANPPFTGTIDKDDLHPIRFPKGTRKSELLFLWLILDLLKVGGRAAVIIPEGVLFGATNAHKELRRRLLFENCVEAVVSLPAGVFQPYTGVKTSVLLFQRVHPELRDNPLPAGQPPRTDRVWFYQVEADGFSLDAKRNEQPHGDNDLWDVLYKWHHLDDNGDPQVDTDGERHYYRSEVRDARWRLVDDTTINRFPELAGFSGEAWGINERHPKLPGDPTEVRKILLTKQSTTVNQLFEKLLDKLEIEAAHKRTAGSRYAVFDKGLRDFIARIHAFASKKKLLDTEAPPKEQFAYNALKELLDKTKIDAFEKARQRTDAMEHPNYRPKNRKPRNNIDWNEQAEMLVRAFAPLDGFDVQLRDNELYDERKRLGDQAPKRGVKCWSTPLRAVARDDEWEGPHDLLGSHDEAGEPRAEYLSWLEKEKGAFSDGMLDPAWLEPDCIEANGLNLSAARYQPFELESEVLEPPAEILASLFKLEEEIQRGMMRLKGMVEGVE